MSVVALQYAAPGAMADTGPRIAVFDMPELPSAPERLRSVAAAAEAVLSGRELASREAVFRSVRALCLHGCGDELWGRLAELCRGHGAAQGRALKAQGDSLGARADETWRSLCSGLRELDRLCHHLPGPSLADLCLGAFRSSLPLEALRAVALDLVDEARRGEPRAEQASLLELFARLQLDLPLVERTRAFYRLEAAALSLPLAEDLKHCEGRLEGEGAGLPGFAELRASQVAACHEELLERRAEGLLASLPELERTEDLRRLHRLLGKHPALRRAWATFARDRVNRAIAGEGAVKRLLELYQQLNTTLKNAFDSAPELTLALKEVLEECFVAPILPKLLARHIDDCLKDAKHETNEELEGTLQLFCHLASKDAFEAFYRKDLSRRLLLGHCREADEHVVQKLREECGAGFTSKLECMFKDVDNSRDLTSAFMASHPIQQDEPEFNFHVLAAGLWPAHSADMAYPLPVERRQSTFGVFYTTKYAGRTLKWAPALGSVMLRAALGRRCELLVSAVQAVVLLRFNDCGSYSMGELLKMALTEDARAELRRALAGLALHKHIKLLNKEPRNREILDTDIFSLNTAFSHRSFRVVVPQLSIKDQQDEDLKVESRLFEDRQMEVDAAVVRIMKQKRTMQHQQLMAEVFRAVKFSASAVDIKKRVNSLIEREYLERDSEDSAKYRYLV